MTNISDKVDVFGYSISARGVERDVKEAFEWVKDRQRARYMACANPHSLVVASRDFEFREALKEADILIPDGIGIILAAKAMNTPIGDRVSGSEYFIRMTEMAQGSGGLKYFFLGSSENVLARIGFRLQREYPSIDVCGTYSPPYKNIFSASDNAQILTAINNSKPDVLWVGMTAPKQEKWIYQNRSKLDVPFIGAIGAVFDFYAGTKARSSIFWQKYGLEWLPRFFREPRRLWERNMKSTPIFLSWIVREKMRRSFSAGKKPKEKSVIGR